MILISACLAGENCKYSGGNNLVEEIRELLKEGKAVAVCPEKDGGLPVPRDPAEIIDDRVISVTGADVTDYYLRGARIGMDVCRRTGCTRAILKANSPSCGPHCVYDGTFTHTLVYDKCGIFAAMLKEAGVECIDETEYIQSLHGGTSK